MDTSHYEQEIFMSMRFRMSMRLRMLMQMTMVRGEVLLSSIHPPQSSPSE